MFLKFKIAETENFRKQIGKNQLKNLYNKIEKLLYPQLRTNPFFGPNIKKLKGEFNGLYRIRIGNYRLFYTIDKQKVIVFILEITQRKDAYN
ncbi:MAG TPA: type II toxin-antitoxin system RelE/ParE family toxin [Ignavibacteria bacterium]|nr:type II toxin-antitoxin system RelE/ParE family toxin [Ignavibacteria bacterium]